MTDLSVLILDDDHGVRSFLVACLEGAGYSVRATGEPDECRRWLTGTPPEVLISDVRLPGIPELGVLEWPELAASGAETIVITGYPDTDLAIRALKAGVADFLRKPLDVGTLRASVARCLEKRTLKQRNAELMQQLQQMNAELGQTVAEQTAELRATVEELREAKETLVRLDVLKSQFINIVSHEFNTPLNVIKGYVQLFRDQVFGRLGHDQLDALGTVEREVDRVVELLREFVTIHALESESFRFSTEPIQVRPFVYATVEKLGPFFAQRRHQFIINVPESLPRIEANRRQLSIVIDNLLVNAIRFTPDGGLITFSAQSDVRNGRSGVLFVTKDTGVGIPRAEFERIFDRFYELGEIDRHTSDTVGFGGRGLGLGLAIARRIVEEHGGEIWVKSDEGRGSRFYFFLPAVRGQARSYRQPGRESTTILRLDRHSDDTDTHYGSPADASTQDGDAS